MSTEKRRGRPRKGRGTLPTSEMPRLTALFEPELLAQMRALAQLRDVPLYQLVNDGCRLLWDNLVPEERERVEQLRTWKLADADADSSSQVAAEPSVADPAVAERPLAVGQFEAK